MKENQCIQIILPIFVRFFKTLQYGVHSHTNDDAIDPNNGKRWQISSLLFFQRKEWPILRVNNFTDSER